MEENNFTNLGLSQDLLDAITSCGYTTPTPIQEKAIPQILMGRDLIASAQTGTGKTASFTLPMIDILSGSRARARMPRALILTPTRELAAQVEENFINYGKNSQLTTALIIGGDMMEPQIAKLDRGVDVVIATPGRLLDLFERGKIMLNDIKLLVIDECDRMLDMGFIPDIEKICGLLPVIRQTLLFSATMPEPIKKLAERFMISPRMVSVAPPAAAAKTIEQALVTSWPENKRKVLRALIKSENVQNAFIFCNRKRDVAILHSSLRRHGFNAGSLHGDMIQSLRTETLEQFRRGDISLLVCSDVAARGIDINAVSHVFNFDVPTNPEDYIHRIGRTGRAGETGRAFTIAAPHDGFYIQLIEKLTGSEIPVIGLEDFDSPPLIFDKNAKHDRSAPKERRDRTKKGKEKADFAAGPERNKQNKSLIEPPEPKFKNKSRNSKNNPTEKSNYAYETAVADEDSPSVLGFGSDLPAFFTIDTQKIYGNLATNEPDFQEQEAE